MLDLSNVTLISFTTKNYEGIRQSVAKCRSLCKFHDTIIFTDKPDEFPDCETIKIRPIEPDEVAVINIITIPHCRERYADFTLTIHDDSWVINPAAWTNEFFDYDYVGAVWWNGMVGNDGFCLKSKKMMEAIAELPVEATPEACRPSDCLVCLRKEYPYYPKLRCFRDELEEKGIKYATNEIADKFSVEDRPYTGSFGFHGFRVLASLKEQGLV